MFSPSQFGISLNFSFFPLQNQNKNTPLMPRVSSNLNCTINPTFTYFDLPYLTDKLVRNRNICLTLLFLHVTMVSLTFIPLCLLADWKMWPFTIENGLISIPGQLKITMHLSCQNTVIIQFCSNCSNICMITPQLKNLWLTVNVFVKQ